MSFTIRLLLIIGSFITSGFILYKVRKSKVQIEDSIFWLLFSAMVFLLSIFPEIAFFFSNLFGFESPINFIYLVMIFVVIVHQFWLTMRLSQTNNKLKEVVQRKAIDDFNLDKCKVEKSKEENTVDLAAEK